MDNIAFVDSVLFDLIMYLLALLCGFIAGYFAYNPRQNTPEPSIHVVVAKLKSGRFKWKMIKADTGQTLAFQPGSGFNRADDALGDAREKFSDLQDIEVLN